MNIGKALLAKGLRGGSSCGEAAASLGSTHMLGI